MARFNEWSPELERALAEPFPPELIQQKRKGSSSIDFVSWHHYARRLNDLVGSGWSVGELSFREVGDKLLTALPLTIFGVTRMNVGTEDESKDDFGDAATNSWATAFKRSCALFGLGLGMYDKGGVAARYAVQEGHQRALDYIRDTAARCAPDVVLVLDGEHRAVQAATKEAWPTLKRDREAALKFAAAVAEATGETFNP